MRVDEPRHDEGPTEVDHLRDRRARPVRDLPVLDDDLSPGDRIGARAVEEGPAADDDGHAGTRSYAAQRSAAAATRPEAAR